MNPEPTIDALPETEPTISCRDPDTMERAECVTEIKRLKQEEIPGWQKRARKLITRIAFLDGIPTARFGIGPPESRSASIADPAPGNDPGDDPLAQRVRAVMDADKKKSNTSPGCGGKSRATDNRLLEGHAGVDWDCGGHAVPTVEFNYDELHDGPGPTEAERKRLAGEEKAARLEVLARAMAFIERDGDREIGDREIVRRVRLVSHYIRPLRTQSELGRLIGLSQPATYQALQNLKREIGDK